MHKTTEEAKLQHPVRCYPKRYVQIPRGSIILLMLIAHVLLTAGPVFGIRIIDIDFLFDIKQDFKEPSDVAVSEDGHIYVVDGVNNKIKVFNSNGRPISSFGEKGDDNGRFRYPLGMDVDAAGKLYIADSGNHRIQIFNPDHTFETTIELPDRNGSPADPTDVAVDRQHKRLYVVDNDNHRLLVYDLSTLNLTEIIGRPGNRELMFRYPFLAALDEEQYLYVVDVINTRVQAINPDGEFVSFIGRWGVEKGELYRPKGVATGPDRRIYVSDSYMGVVQAFDRWGQFEGVLGDAESKTVKKFKTPVGICTDGGNRIYVVEMLAQKVSVYRIETGN